MMRVTFGEKGKGTIVPLILGENSLSYTGAHFYTQTHFFPIYRLHQSVRAVITKYHSLGSLSNRNYYLIIQEISCPRSRSWQLVSSETSLLGLLMAIFSLGLHILNE